MQISYIVYVMVDNTPFDMFGEFNTLVEAQAAIDNVLKAYPEDTADMYAIYKQTEERVQVSA